MSHAQAIADVPDFLRAEPAAPVDDPIPMPRDRRQELNDASALVLAKVVEVRDARAEFDEVCASRKVARDRFTRAQAELLRAQHALNDLVEDLAAEQS